MKPETKRKVQLLIAAVIYGLAAVLSYFSVVETGGGNGGKYDIYLVLDVSGSMSGQKLDAAKEAAVTFIRTLNLASNPEIRVGIITFSTDVYVRVHLSSDENNLINTVQGLVALQATALGDAITTGVDKLVLEGSTTANWTIVAMTDGLSNADRIKAPLEAADYANQSHIVVHAIAFGEDADTTTLQEIARRTGGKYYFATTGTELITIYGQIALSFISPALHYGSRFLMLIALPLILFLPELQKGATTVYKTILTTVLKKPIEIRGLRCPECGHLNRATARFCGSCRTPLITAGKPCPKCEHVNRFGAKFCGGCGMRLEN